MQRLVRRRKTGQLVQEGDNDPVEQAAALADAVELVEAVQRELELEAAESVESDTPSRRDPTPPTASEPSSPSQAITACSDSTLLSSSGPGKFRASSRQVNLHSFDRQSDLRATGFAETKIGGHGLDHKRPFYEDWRQQLHGPLKTAVWGALGALGTAITGGLTSPSTAPARSSPAYAIPKPEVLVYSAVKIGGHALDHVPFHSRGQPSRPLLGYVPPDVCPPPAVTYEIAPNVSNLYDCSRCFRLRQSPRVQLCCGHRVCASCVASRSIKHVEHQRTCFLECARCSDLVAVEAVVFTNYILRMEPFSARTVSELQAAQAKASEAASASLSGAWKQGGVVAALSFIAGRFVPTHLTSKQKTRKQQQQREVAHVKKLVADVAPDGADQLLLDGVAGLAQQTAKAEATIKNGAERWAKRVRGLQTPSKLLKFEFVRTLGMGNFAEVMLIKNRKGALSVLKESDKLPEATNEISILSRFSTPHVVNILQYFVEEIGHRHFAYIEMEYCDRGDLKQMLETKGPLQGADFDALFRQVCLGLQEIHRHGIVHRDLKPGNVLLTAEGVAKLADFGVSTYLESDLLTHHAAGTLAFMAPEVRRYFLGEDISYDAQADIWSLGALAVAMLTGEPEPRVATRPVEELVEELREKSLADKYVRLVEGMLAASPADRVSLDELLQEFPPMNARL